MYAVVAKGIIREETRWKEFVRSSHALQITQQPESAEVKLPH